MTASAYDGIAEWYDAWVDGPLDDDPYVAAVEALMGDVAGQRVCDLACGQGRFARRMAARGVRVVGVDISEGLLALARRREHDAPLGIDYRRADARRLEGLEDGSFDGVVCLMALMDIAELRPTLQSVARILRPGGWFVFVTLHPCFNTPRSGERLEADGWVRTIGAYFDERHWRSDTRTGPPGKVGAYHWTLSSYLNSLLDAGLTIEQISEPPATPAVAAARPIWVEVPAVLATRSSKVSRE